MAPINLTPAVSNCKTLGVYVYLVSLADGHYIYRLQHLFCLRIILTYDIH